MGMELVKQEIKTGEVLCQRYSQTMAESDVIVPDSKPDIKKVLEVSGNVCITQKLLQQDKAMIQGVVRMTVLYLPEGEVLGQIKSLTVSQEFNHSMDCRGAMPDMQFSAEAEPESFDFTLINSRKLHLRCMLGIGVKVTRPTVLSLTVDAENCCDLQLKKERLRLCSATESTESQIILREQLDLPPGKPGMGEILKVTAVPSSQELCMMDNKAVAKGQVRLCVLYNSDLETCSVEFMEFQLPFTEILDIEGSTEGMEGEIEYTVNDMYYEIRDDAQGEPRCLGVELVLGACLRGTELTEAEAVTDAYSLTDCLNLTTKSYRLEQLLDNSTAEISLRDQAQLPPMLPKLSQVCDLNAYAKIQRISAEDGEITVYGAIHTNILYLSQEEALPVAGFSHISEFSHCFSVPGADSETVCDARVVVEHLSYTLSGDDSLELRFVLGLAVKSLNTGSTLLVEEIETAAPEGAPPCPCIILYFVQKGDSLWSIAKRFHTTVADIRTANQIDGDLILPGQRLKIFGCTD